MRRKNPEKYREAVLFAKERLNAYKTNDIRDYFEEGSRHDRLEQSLEELAQAPQHANDYDFLTTLAAYFLRTGKKMPDYLAVFAANVLEGKQKRPTKRGPNPFGNWERDYKLFNAVREVAERYKLPLYTTNEFSEKTTAADVVSDAARLSVNVVTTACKEEKRKKGLAPLWTIPKPDSAGG